MHRDSAAVRRGDAAATDRRCDTRRHGRNARSRSRRGAPSGRGNRPGASRPSGGRSGDPPPRTSSRPPVTRHGADPADQLDRDPLPVHEHLRAGGRRQDKPYDEADDHAGGEPHRGAAARPFDPLRPCRGPRHGRRIAKPLTHRHRGIHLSRRPKRVSPRRPRRVARIRETAPDPGSRRRRTRPRPSRSTGRSPSRIRGRAHRGGRWS